MAFEELGPTYIKLGQVLSTRPDLVPVDVVNELVKLQDEVPPFSFEEVKDVVEAEFGKPSEELFDELVQQPLASASIGQVPGS
jgi:ubiquinone biosynthesis protein